ncbi:hypothetical protein FHE72_01055 [Rossellomorea vietnamensis]|uniref:Uncharacterized protein n=1 Tax=Rossellomorea vietnamensis TaxID=218284 RepID=A0A6I6UL86_9BACI|nr:hypothetical protein [Rossellomorea vietnamensis]QHE59781.1 hypothetical protein FHE72_01055 [Rossellomorea vietnamensis]
MKLFHSSNKRLSTLTPTIGGSRHKGEDPRAVNKPVVYLTTSEEETFAENGITHRFKYIVEMSLNDPDLYLDEKDFEFRQECNETFGENDTTRWYFLKKPISVLETLEWDGKKYVKRNNF